MQLIWKPGRKQPSPMPNGKGTSMPPQLFWQPGLGWKARISARASTGSKSAVHIDGRITIIALTQSLLDLLVDMVDSSSFSLKNASNLSADLIANGEWAHDDQEDLLMPIKNFKKVK
jgi:hypothetical protein